MKHWIGRWLVGVSLCHSVFATLFFGKVIGSMAQRGLLNTVTDTKTAYVAWFLLFGAMLFVCGLAVAALEGRSPNTVPKTIGWALFAVAATIVILMPASGAWLVFPPAIAIIIKKSASTSAAIPA